MTVRYVLSLKLLAAGNQISLAYKPAKRPRAARVICKSYTRNNCSLFVYFSNVKRDQVATVESLQKRPKMPEAPQRTMIVGSSLSFLTLL